MKRWKAPLGRADCRFVPSLPSARFWQYLLCNGRPDVFALPEAGG